MGDDRRKDFRLKRGTEPDPGEPEVYTVVRLGNGRRNYQSPEFTVDSGNDRARAKTPRVASEEDTCCCDSVCACHSVDSAACSCVEVCTCHNVCTCDSQCSCVDVCTCDSHCTCVGVCNCDTFGTCTCDSQCSCVDVCTCNSQCSCTGNHYWYPT